MCEKSGSAPSAAGGDLAVLSAQPHGLWAWPPSQPHEPVLAAAKTDAPACPSRASTPSIDSRSTCPLLTRACPFFGPELDFERRQHSAPTDHGRHAQGDVADAISPGQDAGDRQHGLAVQGDRFDHFLNRQPDGEPGRHLFSRSLRRRSPWCGGIVHPPGPRSSPQSAPAASRPPWRSTRSAPCCRRVRPGSTL